MRLFSLRNSRPPDAPVTLWVEGEQRWRLPNHIGCPECGVYGSIGPGYPTVDLSDLPISMALEEPAGVSVRQLEELRGAVMSRVPPGAPLPGGTGFGPFIGRLRGTRGDLVIAEVAHLLMRPAAYEALSAVGVRLPAAVLVLLRGRGADRHPLVELELVPGADLDDASYQSRAPRPCPVCGRWDRTLERVVVRADSVTRTIDVFRAGNHVPVLLGTERFVEAVQRLGLSGLSMSEVEIVAPPT